MKRPNTLSAAFVRTVSVPGRYGDGRGGYGLSLLVKTMSNGRLSKSWSQRLRWHGAPFNIGLGAYPLVMLAEARAAALANARAVVQGIDPRGGGVPSLADAAETVIALHEPTWKAGAKTAAMWRASLAQHVMPRLGRKTVDKITTADVLAVLSPIWHSKPELSRKIRQRLSTVFKWCVAEGHRPDNPAGDAIGAALPRNGKGVAHHRSLHHAAVADALATVQASAAHWSTKVALEFVAVTACRSGEARGARWSEFDLSAAVWTIPASRMKSGREFRVPLSSGALEILRSAAEKRDGSGLVFPSMSGREMSDNTLSKLLRELSIDCVPHGFRSSFRNWCAEIASVPREVAESCLAHATGRNKTEQAYFRSDLYDLRADLMERWSQYLRR